MKEFKNKIDAIIDKTFSILQSGNNETRLVFPSYSNGSRRVSEQELRFVFVEQMIPLLKEYNFFYSVETPTNDRYKFSDHKKYCIPSICNDGQSASFDLTIKDATGNNMAIIEFKAKMANKHEYAKDICKLWNVKEKASIKYFVNLFERIDDGTIKKFKEKIDSKTNEWLLPKTSNEKIYVVANSLVPSDKVDGIKYCI